jgi:anti-anti-sigma regulatory factor
MAQLRIVEALARLQLAAKQRGGRIAVIGPAPDLRELIHLCGLTDALCVEARRQPEQREQRRSVEEERELDEPPA